MNRKDKDRLNMIIQKVGENRFCDSCNQYHGYLYICPNYSDKLKAEIKEDNRIFVEFLRNEKMVKRAIKKGVPRELIMFWRIFAGVI